MTDRTTMFDSKSDAFMFKTVGGSLAIPALHIVKPRLHDANFSGNFGIEGFYAYSFGCEEPFTGVYAASEENGVTIDVLFSNPKMQEHARTLKFRPVIYWHSDDDDGGLELEVNVKFMTAAGGR